MSKHAVCEACSACLSLRSTECFHQPNGPAPLLWTSAYTPPHTPLAQSSCATDAEEPAVSLLSNNITCKPSRHIQSNKFHHCWALISSVGRAVVSHLPRLYPRCSGQGSSLT